MNEGVLLERIHSLDKSRRGFLAAITRVCNRIDQLLETDSSDIQLIRQLQSSLKGTLQNYKVCCQSYMPILDTSCEKYVEIITSYRDQNKRVRLYVEKLNALLMEVVKSEISKLELEIQQSEREIQNTMMSAHNDHQVCETVDKAFSREPMMITTYQQQNDILSDNNCDNILPYSMFEPVSAGGFDVIPPPPVFVSMTTARPYENNDNDAISVIPPPSQYEHVMSAQVAEGHDISVIPPPPMFANCTTSHGEYVSLKTSTPIALPVGPTPDTPSGSALDTLPAPQESHRDRVECLDNSNLCDIKLQPKLNHNAMETKSPLEYLNAVSLPQGSQSDNNLKAVNLPQGPQRYVNLNTGNLPLGSQRYVNLDTGNLSQEPQHCLASNTGIPQQESERSLTSSKKGPNIVTETSSAKPLEAFIDTDRTLNNTQRIKVTNPHDSTVYERNTSIVEALVASMEKMSATRDLPQIKVLKFDGSPDKYPTFLLRFNQLVGTKHLDDTTKMTRLLQFLEGPALLAVQRYETLPGGLQRSLEILEDRFGRPYHVVKACIDSMTKGPPISAADHQALQRFADDVQANYDILSSMGFLSEINTDMLEKILSRLPRGTQNKFVEHLRKLETAGHSMPTFKDVVDFLKDRAHVANHPFLAVSSPSTARSPLKQPVKPTFKSCLLTTTATTTKERCLKCSKDHNLYKCETFKALTARERADFAKSNHLCFNCLSSGHNVKQCKSTARCRANGCGKPHHTLLHFDRKEETPASPPTTTEPKVNYCIAAKKNSHGALLQILPLRIASMQGDTITTYGLLDSGSDVTMIDQSLALMLGMKGSTSKLRLSTVSDTSVEECGLKVKFKMSSLDSGECDFIIADSAWAIKDLSIPLKHIDVIKDGADWPHLQHIPFPEVERKKVSVLIGTNINEAFVPLEVRRGNHGEPFAIRSCIGWSILGGASDGILTGTSNVNNVSEIDTTLDDHLKHFWKVESYGAEMLTSKPMSVEDKRAMAIVEETLCKDGNNYKMGLLWKEPELQLPYNRPLAEARINHLKRRLQGDPQLFTKYKAVMDDYISKGYAVKLSKEEAAKVSNKTWYLPHHPVSNPNKPDKIRVVFDAAARYQGTSLNDNLLQGPCLINDLTGVLLRFREERVAFTADVNAIFHQVQVTDDDTDALRFLWWTDGDLNKPPEEFKMCVHIFGAKSSPCCANKALRSTALDNVDAYNSEAVKAVQRNFYVDDVLRSAPTEERAISLATDLVKLLAEGGFRLSKFSSNSRKVLASIDAEDRVDPKLDMDLDRLPIGRTLGVYWDPESDAFGFKFVPSLKPPTKRGILSVVSSLFDPLGFLAPLVLPVKILLQDLWRMGVSWDEEVPEPFLTIWKEWLGGIPHVVNINISRCLKPQGITQPTSIQLHIFSGASRRGLAVVAYLRMLCQLHQVYCSFVMGKVKNAPAKEWTIPRLELQAAVLATRLSRTLLKELDLPIHSTIHWTDSLTTLQYIRNLKRRFPVFESNRITEIHEATEIGQWRHVPGLQNPADEGSRGVSVDYFKDDCRWFREPDFLHQPEDQWPREDPPPPRESENDLEAEPTFSSNSTSLKESTVTPVSKLLRRYSSWSRLLRVMAWVLRFVNNARGTMKISSDVLKLSELERASHVTVRLAQRECFPQELDDLEHGQQVKRTSPLSALDPILVDDTLRVGGRIRNAPLSSDVKQPMILPRDHYISELVVAHYHKILGHAGREHVLSTIRLSYWIVNARSLVRRLLHKCVGCRKRYAQPMQQVMGNLPKERLTPYKPPFTYTGVDFFGPFYVKRGRGTEKIYGCIFVCFTTRAIHIEDASSLSTDAFISALRRFIAVRGCPLEIWSDNGTNFTGAAKELRSSIKAFNEDLIRNELHSKGSEWYSCPMPKWKFQTPTASHTSGVWERLIRSVRKTMAPLLGNPNSSITLETLRTVFAEAVSILNSRPLSPSSDDPTDLEPLTPNHFLLLRPNVTPPPGVFNKNDVYTRKNWKHAQFIDNHFWTRWIREYVTLLQQRQKWTAVRRNLKIDDLVLITDSTEPRSRWLLGRVIKVYPGNDNHIRTAQVKTKNSTLMRPINKLCLLEESS